MSSRLASNAYAALAWVVAAIALLHMATTWRLHVATPFTRVWFFGAGIAMAQAAALNLLHRKYGRSAVGVRWITRAVNIVILAFATVAGAVTGATTVERIVMLGVLTSLLILSFTSVVHPNP
jgi:hypothetical protein